MKIFRKTNEIYDIRPEDNSTQRVVHMGENVLNLTFRTSEPLDLRIGDYIVFAATTYKLKELPSPQRISRYELEYVCRFVSPQYDLQDVVFIFEDSTGVGVLDEHVPIFGTAELHLQQIVKCVQKVHPEWKIGDIAQTTEEKTVTYTDMDCLQALQHLAKSFNLEYWVAGTTISLGKKKYGSSILFKYGRGNALYDLRRENQSGRIVTALHVRGSDRNIDSFKYKHKYLHLPGGERFIYKNIDKYGVIQDRISFPEVFPRLIHKNPNDPGAVTSVREKDGIFFIKDEHLDFIPTALPDKKIVVDFQTGQLGGLKIDANYNADTKEFELVKGDYGLGQEVPTSIFVPSAGDKYLLSNIIMPQAYIDAAERELLEKAQEAINQVCEAKVSYKGAVNPLYFRTLGETIETGRTVRVEDVDIVDGGSVELRVQAYTRGVNDDLSLDIEISDTLYISKIDKLKNEIRENKNDSDRKFKEGSSETLRRFRDAKETYEMLEKSLLNFSKAVNPVAVQTMQLLVGDESLQFRYVNSKTNPVEVDHTMRYDNNTRMFRAGGPEIIQHMTLGIKSIAPSHAATEYKFWDIAPFEDLISDSDARYVYIKCSSSGTTGGYVLSKTPIEMNSVSGHYHFLAGILNSEFEGKRSFVPMYGFTEITPGQMRVNKIINTDGTQFWDMLSKRFRIGDANSYLSYNVDKPNQLVLKGTLVQSPSGQTDHIGIDRGNWVPNTIYYPGDVVKYQGSIYKCMVQNHNIAPVNTSYWKLQVSKGKDGSYLKRVYRRASVQPALPIGPGHGGWNEHPPGGSSPLWMSEAKFSASGVMQSEWSIPVKVTGEDGSDGQGYMYAYYPSDSLTPPPRPTTSGFVPYGWRGSPDFEGKRFIYIIQSVQVNGQWGAWSHPRLFSRLPEPGDPGPAIVYRGEWAKIPSPRRFYNNAARRDVVKFNGTYYIFKGPDASIQYSFIYEFWQNFGAQFESVATNLLLAENANIGGWIFKNERLESQSGGAFLDGRTGEVSVKGSFKTTHNECTVAMEEYDNFGNCLSGIDNYGNPLFLLVATKNAQGGGHGGALRIASFEPRYEGFMSKNVAHLSPNEISIGTTKGWFSARVNNYEGCRITINGLPTSGAGLLKGDVYVSNGTLRIKT